MQRNWSITDEGWKAFAAGLAVRCCANVSIVMSFFLCGSPTPVTHLISVNFVLQKNTTLTELSLDGNEIGDEGGKAIGKALEVSFILVSV